MKKLKTIPRFKSEDVEREFWATHDSTDYFDTNRMEPVIFPNLKPTTESISLRMPGTLLARIKELANSQDVPYQSLIKMVLADKLKEEFRSPKPKHSWKPALHSKHMQ